MRIAVIGAGYVGLVTGACLAAKDHQVVCMDNNQEKLNLLAQGRIPIYEPGLEPLVRQNVADGRLAFTDDLQQAIASAEIVFFCLPTPPRADGGADLQHLLQVVDSIGQYLTDYQVLVNKSTVPVGTTVRMAEVLASKTKVDFDMVANPEFLREGMAVSDFMQPDRIIVGTGSQRAREIMLALYRPFVDNLEQIIFMDERSAETTKYAANAFLAMKISFINEVANFCEVAGANVELVSLGIGSDPRIGKQFLRAGLGYGGSCFPKDVVALSHLSKSLGYQFRLLEAVQAVNVDQRNRFVQKVVDCLAGDVGGKKLAIWGLAFKPDTDDIREAPALTVIAELLRLGAKITVYDPKAMEAVRKNYDWNVEYAEDMYSAVAAAEALIIVTEWRDFWNPDFDKLAGLMSSKIIIDGRNLYQPEQMRKLGFQYISVGRPS